MTKAVKKVKSQSNRQSTTREKLVVNGTFMDLIGAAVQHTKNNTPKKKKA